MFYEKRTRRHRDDIRLTGKMEDNPFFFLKRNIIEFRGKEIQIQIQGDFFIRSFLIGSMFCYADCIFDTEDFPDYSFTESRLYIVPDIAPGVREIENLF